MTPYNPKTLDITFKINKNKVVLWCIFLDDLGLYGVVPNLRCGMREKV
jgi:hypothetical protein